MRSRTWTPRSTSSPGAKHITEMPVDQWVGEAAVVDLTHVPENGEVTAADLERQGQHVKAGDIVLLRTDWPKRVSVETEKFWRDAPYTGQSACDWLIQRKVKAVGYDYPPDYCVRTMTFEPQKKLTREDNTTHQAFFPVGITVVEYLTNLDQIGAPRCRFVALAAARGRGRRLACPRRGDGGLAGGRKRPICGVVALARRCDVPAKYASRLAIALRLAAGPF